MTIPSTFAPDPSKLLVGDDFATFDMETRAGAHRLWLPNYRGYQNPNRYNYGLGVEQQLYAEPSFPGVTNWVKVNGVYTNPYVKNPWGPKPLGLNPFRVHDGMLDITASRIPINPLTFNLPFMSGQINTRHSHSQQYGWVEWEVKFPPGAGLWPGLWMLPADDSSPTEIDVFESIGDPKTIYETLHSKALIVAGHPNSYDSFPYKPAFNFSAGFHKYGCFWDPTGLGYYVDGALVHSHAATPDLAKPMYFLTDLAVSGVGWCPPPNAHTVFPATMQLKSFTAWSL